MTTEDICGLIEQQFGQPVTSETPIEALNCDSLEFVQLLLDLGNAAGREIPDSRWGDLKTVGDIAAELA